MGDFLNPASNPAGFTIFIVVVTTVIIVASFVWRMKWSRGLLTGGMEGGTPSTALIAGMGQTGVQINDLPQLTFDLQVRPPSGGMPYEAKVKQTIPYMALGMLAPGRTVAVVISPKDLSKVKIDIQGTANLAAVGAAVAQPGFGGGPAMGAPGIGVPGMSMGAGMPAPGAFGGFQQGGGFAAMGAPADARPGASSGLGNVRSNDDLVASGEPVAATVVAIQETGQFYGSDPIVILTVQVQVPTGPYQVQVGHRVPADKRARLMPGTVLRGHRDPSNPGALGIDWRAL